LLKRISHIGIAVENIEEQRSWYEGVLGLEDAGRDIVEEQGVRVQMYSIGDTRIELLEPLSPDSPVARFIAKRGQGIHHIAYGVENCREALKKALEKGFELIDAEPRQGAHAASIAFLHPRSTFGVLSEFCEERDEGEL